MFEDEQLKLFSVKDLSEMWGVSRQQLMKKVDDGELAVVRFGKAIRFRPVDLVDFLARQSKFEKDGVPVEADVSDLKFGITRKPLE